MPTLDLFKLDGKIALVTGASKGLGQAIAVALAEAGAGIISLSRSPDSGTTAAQISAAGQHYHTIELDLGKASVAELEAAVQKAITLEGRLDILVNNAGMILRAPALNYSETDWDTVLQIDLKAVFFLSQIAARYMEKHGGGKIINIASLLSYQGGILVPSYSAAKHGIVGITKALANEWAAKGINVNAIAPGYIDTEATAPLRADPVRNQSILSRIPAGYWGQPSDLKGAAVFLASDAAKYLHGTTIDVDGGWMAR
ncbi:MAG: 2-dehydro-3-deoxy-D-gluconate 5-dehydrogenase KduD [Chloroflexota bacterium]